MVKSNQILIVGVVGTLAIIFLVYFLDIKDMDIEKKDLKQPMDDILSVETDYDELVELKDRLNIVNKKEKIEIDENISNSDIGSLVSTEKERNISKDNNIETLLKEFKYLYIDNNGSISSNSRKSLEKIIPLLFKLDDIYIEVEGYSASLTDPYISKKASIRFAQIIANYLKERNIDKEIIITGYGDQYPIIDDKTDSRNSRVELKVRRR